MIRQGSSNRQKTINLSRFCQGSLSRRLVGRLPYRWGQAYVAALGTLYHLGRPQEAALIREAAAPVLDRETAAAARHRAYRRIFHGIYAHYHEKLFLTTAALPRLAAFFREHLHLPELPQLQAAQRQGRGVILVTGHFGAVEFLPAALQLAGLPVAILVRPQTQTYAQAIRERAACLGVRVIFPEPGGVLAAALKALRDGLLLISEGDEFSDWRPDPQQSLEFLGCRIPADRSLAVLQRRSRAPVFGALLARDRGPSYHLLLQDFTQVAAAELSARFLAWLAAAIRHAPEQWYQWAGWARFRREREGREGALHPVNLSHNLAAVPAGGH